LDSFPTRRSSDLVSTTKLCHSPGRLTSFSAVKNRKSKTTIRQESYSISAAYRCRHLIFRRRHEAHLPIFNHRGWGKITPSPTAYTRLGATLFRIHLLASHD